MTKQQVKAVKQYLFSINRLELSVANLKNSIEDLKSRMDNPIQATVYDRIVVCGGESSSKPESLAEAAERIMERVSVLEKVLVHQERKLACFSNAMEVLAEEGHMGHLAANIIRHKYIQRISPDRRIYTLKLFCSRDVFYRAHRIALRFFSDVIPELK